MKEWEIRHNAVIEKMTEELYKKVQEAQQAYTEALARMDILQKEYIGFKERHLIINSEGA